MIQSLISYLRKRSAENKYPLSEEEIEKNYWDRQKFAAKAIIKDLSAYTIDEWVYRHCKDLIYTEGVHCFAIRYAMQGFVDVLGKTIYHLHKNLYYDEYRVLLNISKEKKVTLYIKYKNTLIYSQTLVWKGTLPTMKAIAFHLRRITDLSSIQRQCLNFDKVEVLDYLYGLSLPTEISYRKINSKIK